VKLDREVPFKALRNLVSISTSELSGGSGPEEVTGWCRYDVGDLNNKPLKIDVLLLLMF